MQIDDAKLLSPALNTQPVFVAITMEDGGQSVEASLTTLFAFNALAAAAIAPSSDVKPIASLPTTPSIPRDDISTSEDGGKSEGASATSLRAAHILAQVLRVDSDEEDDERPALNTYRPCDGRTPYCC